ncbi:protein lin-52 homolog [Amblyomma americanum]
MVHVLASLSPKTLLGIVKNLQDMAYQLSVEELREMTRARALNIFSKDKACDRNHETNGLSGPESSQP